LPRAEALAKRDQHQTAERRRSCRDHDPGKEAEAALKSVYAVSILAWSFALP